MSLRYPHRYTPAEGAAAQRAQLARHTKRAPQCGARSATSESRGYFDVPYTPTHTTTNSSCGRGTAGRPVTQPTPVSM
jgi:hypothetical protein